MDDLPDNAIYNFVKLAKENGIDIFRVFDCLNNLENLEIGIQAVHAAGGVVEGAIMYTGDMLKPGKYDLDYYMRIVDRLVLLKCHVIAIKSMSGVMKPNAGRVLVRTIRTKYPDIPIHMHTHDTNGTGVATMMACALEGADIVDTATDSLSGSTSQPAVSAMISVLEQTEVATELSIELIEIIDSYWAQLRLMYADFDADLRSPDPAVYKHEIPGGQFSNLMFQARQLGLGSKWKETQEAYAGANQILGDIIKATPTSKAVGDLAQFMVDRKLSIEEVLDRADSLDFPSSVLDYLRGLMGQPFHGFPEPFRTRALRGRFEKLQCRPGAFLKPIDFLEVQKTLSSRYPAYCPAEHDLASFVMYPEVFLDFLQARQEFGDLTNLSTPVFFSAIEAGREISMEVEVGKETIIEMVAVSTAIHPDSRREVFFRLNGELCSVNVMDSKGRGKAFKACQEALLKVLSVVAVLSKQTRPKADIHNINEIAAPISGKITRVIVESGNNVSTGDALLTLSAMKMVSIPKFL
ncbi:MAG: hypothetical protein M1822_002440 [Bathelium mastoideum]|nr:MAG: hypothetical protein M1822_002440 [Bathelium mastoideum]